MSNIKTIKKGEFIFKEGDKPTQLFIIQSGQATACLVRPKKHLDIYAVGANQVVGELALLNNGTFPYSMLATQECKVVEVPVEIVKMQTETLPQTIKAMLKSFSERLKQNALELKSMKMASESTPCPEAEVAKIFGALFHTAHHKGKKDEKTGKIVVDWTLMKNYAQRVFVESPKRLEQAICILIKLKLAEFQMVKNEQEPDQPDEIGFVHFSDLATVENFFEFYQYYYFKGGKTELLKPDEMCSNLVTAMIKSAEGVEPDRHGYVRFEYPKLVEKLKAEMNMNISGDHFARLEMKGLFPKRQTTTEGQVFLQFELKEFRNTLASWKILREIEKWNEKGFVDLNEDLTKKPAAVGGGTKCPQCQAAAPAKAKFCPECGTKIQIAA